MGQALIFRLPKRGVLVAIVLTSAVNLLALTGPLFMIEVYDRVIPSKSIPTLVALSGLAAFLFCFSGILDIVRGRIMSRAASIIDEAVSSAVFEITTHVSSNNNAREFATRPSNDLDQVRSFVSGNGLLALFDLPWAPIYLIVCYLIHPYIGIISLFSLMFLFVVATLTHFITRSQIKVFGESLNDRSRLEDELRRNAEAAATMGLNKQFLVRWKGLHRRQAGAAFKLSDLSGAAASVAKTFRYAIQSGVLALGAYLVVDGQLTGGMIIASSVIVSRALAPAEQVIGQWKSATSAWQALKRLRQSYAYLPDRAPRTTLPAPHLKLELMNIAAAPPQSQLVSIKDVSFALEAGSILGVIGPSASGKSSLVRVITGIWEPLRGSVRVDGASIAHWTEADRGAHIGYLPQAVELFEGTVAENISRFDPSSNHEDIVLAASDAGAHDMIVRLPNGYETQVGQGGRNLSAGQKQRIGLARALFRRPFLTILDEPNSNLDLEGEQALGEALIAIRGRGGIAVVVAHRPNVMSVVDHVLMLKDGDVATFGRREALVSGTPHRASGAALKVVERDD